MLSESVKCRNDPKLWGKIRSKKKHKRLDAICEKTYNRCHKGVQHVDASDFNNIGEELELRRSNRTRRAPILLDSSPLPAKKRPKVDRSDPIGIEEVRREFGVKYESHCSSSRNLDEQNGVWRPRLRFRGKSTRSSGWVRGEKNLFEDLNGFRDNMKTQYNGGKEGLIGDKSTVVMSKGPGRIKASNVLENGEHETDVEEGFMDDKENKSYEAFGSMDDVHGLNVEVNIAAEDDVAPSNLCEKVEAEVPRRSKLEEGHNCGSMDLRTENTAPEKLSYDITPEERDAVQVENVLDDFSKGEVCLNKPPEDEAHNKLKGKDNALDTSDRKPRIKLGRRCGLCGGGTNGKPPKILVLEGIGSDNEAYSGPAAPEESNYDVWDGFGDEPGWLGRLLGPVNDRLGIAGIWVHQQCAVWSPEVYFAGFGCLKNIRAALYRGKMLKCNRCKRRGATIGCRVDRCPKTYHLPCARSKGCIFDHRKFLIACTDHRHLFQPYGIERAMQLKKMKARKMKLELRKMSNDAFRKDIEAEEKWLENCGEDEEFLKRESRRLHRDLRAIAPVYIGGTNSESKIGFEGWESVAGMKNVIQCMKEVVILPLLYPEFFKNMALTPPRGVLLHGYPGTGKTLVVRALVGSCARGDKRIAYFARKGADCLGKYVGDSERQLRLLFQVAEKSQPSIIFFDEIDGLAPCRTKQQDQTHSSVVSTLLALMDGLKSRGSVIVIGATNRPEAVDPALRRPGRFDREIYFPLPLEKDREAILSLHTQKWPKPITGSLLNCVAKRTVGFAGADLQALCTQAAIIALRRSFPLQEVLSMAETKASHSKLPPIPSFSVEERDWLMALSCALPPCSRREGGIVVNDVISSPLDAHLVPCLLQPLTKLLLLLYLDERVWLPSPLNKISKSVKAVLDSVLDLQRVQNDNWWSHVDALLQDDNVANEIVKIFSIANVLVGETLLPTSNAVEDYPDGTFQKLSPPNSQLEIDLSFGLRNFPYTTCYNSGFQILISGKPRSGQRHLASCLLHHFVGNVDVWKVDMASISQEGHGDIVHGLTRILMRCGGTNLCMIYMPNFDLWATENYNEAVEGSCDLSSMEHQSCENLSLQGSAGTDMEHESCSSVKSALKEHQNVVTNVSYLWTLFIEQVETLRVNTPLIILATSELHLSLLPHRIRQCFVSGNKSGSITSTLDQQVPQFSVQLDGKFDFDQIINLFVMKLLKDLVKRFVVSIYERNHPDEDLWKKRADDIIESDVDRVSHSKSYPAISPAPFKNKSMKGKSSLLLAISTVGYQILCYPHFAELCWVTSKLEEGPSYKVDGSFRGWPFNSCIYHPISSTEKLAAASGSGNVQSKVSGIVRGLVSVGLSAYSGEYTSLKEVCSDIRKVLEILVKRIDYKIQTGKDRRHFIGLLSQVAYLDDMIFSWAYAMRSLEVSPSTSRAATCIGLGSLEDGVHKGTTSEGNKSIPEVSNGVLRESGLVWQHVEEVGVREYGHSEPINSNDECLNTGEDVVGTGKMPSQLVALNHSSPSKFVLTPNNINLELKDREILADVGESGDNNGFVLKNNGFTDDSEFQVDSNHGSINRNEVMLSSVEVTCEGIGLPLTDNIFPEDNCKDSCSVGLHVNHDSNPTGLTACSAVTCYFECCSDCVINLRNLLLGIIELEWRHKESDVKMEDVHDFVSTLSVNLHLTLDKLCRAESSSGRTSNSCCEKDFECHKCHKTSKSECSSSERRSINKSGDHGWSKNAPPNEGYSQTSSGIDSSFVFSGGLLVNFDRSLGVSYHCKFEKLCLCPLIEWLVTCKKPFD